MSAYLPYSIWSGHPYVTRNQGFLSPFWKHIMGLSHLSSSYMLNIYILPLDTILIDLWWSKTFRQEFGGTFHRQNYENAWRALDTVWNCLQCLCQTTNTVSPNVIWLEQGTWLFLPVSEYTSAQTNTRSSEPSALSADTDATAWWINHAQTSGWKSI